MNPREIAKKNEEAIARVAMENLGLSLEEARAWGQNEMRQRWEGRVRIYDFLKSQRPDIVALEKDRIRRIEQVAEQADIDQPTAAAVVVVGDLLTERARRRIMRKGGTGKKRMVEKYVAPVSIQQDILDLLPEVDDFA